MPNFNGVQCLQLVYKTSGHVTAVTKQVAHHLISYEVHSSFHLIDVVIPQQTLYHLNPGLMCAHPYWECNCITARLSSNPLRSGIRTSLTAPEYVTNRQPSASW